MFLVVQTVINGDYQRAEEGRVAVIGNLQPVAVGKRKELLADAADKPAVKVDIKAHAEEIAVNRNVTITAVDVQARRKERKLLVYHRALAPLLVDIILRQKAKQLAFDIIQLLPLQVVQVQLGTDGKYPALNLKHGVLVFIADPMNDLMELLHLSRKTLIQYIRTGKLKAFRVGSAYRVTDDSLQDYIAKTSVIADK
jgi:excisionase family DNA binding protein